MKNVVDIYPLTSVQSGMLFHTLDRSQHRKGTYINQFTCELSGDVQPEKFRQAWQQAIARHPVLRTAVLWEGLDEPLQVVRETVKLPWQQLNWQTQTAAEQATQMANFLQRDRTQGFNLAQAPLLRLTLIQLTPSRYQFIWSNHHLLYDGWSLLLIWQDVLSNYSAQSHPEQPHSAQSNTAQSPARPFRDYVAWQQQQDRSAAKAFWQEQLQELSEPTPLPAARSSTTTTDRPYRQQSKLLSAELLSKMKALSQQHRLTLNTLVQGAWALLLNHYSDGLSPAQKTAKVTYGSVVSGRPAALKGVEKMVGLFINTLPVTVSIDPDRALIPWLQDRQQQLLAIREHEATPLSNIQKWSDFPPRTPLFESIVAFENLTAAPAPELDFKINNTQYIEQSNYPLALLVFPQSDPETGPNQRLDLRLLYNADRFEDSILTQLLTHLEQLLTAFVANPQVKLAHLPRLTPAEQTQLSAQPQTDYPRNQCIHQLIEAQVIKTPDQLAVCFEDESLTYTELNQRANQLAHLIRHKLRHPQRIALCLDRSVNMIVSILAVLKAGAAYVPLDPTYPQSRLAYCLQDTGPDLLITQRSVSLPDTDVPCLYIDEENIESQATTNPESTAAPQDLAYIIYTSGSTGQPKGVMVSHRNLVHSTTARFTVYQEPVDRFLLLSSIAFDSSIAGIFWTLCQGGLLIISPQRIEQDLQRLADLISHQQITHTLCVPTLYSLLLENAEKSQLDSLKTVIVAGEACSRSLAQQHHLKLPTTELYNEYGPTEATVWCSAYRVPKTLSPGAVSIGTAIPNVQIRLFNSLFQPVPWGAVGEICVGGEGVSQGYLNQPERTAAVFVESLDGDKNKQRFYKTGDLGRYRADGKLEWLGRRDRQVKIRGYRIELGEIEEALQQQPGVQEAVVVARSQSSAPSINDLVMALEALSAEQSDALLSTVEREN